MAQAASIIKLLVRLLWATFGHLTPPALPDDTTLNEGYRIDIEVPVPSGKVSFSAEERRTEFIARIALSEEALAAGLIERVQEWVTAAKLELPKASMKKLDKNVRVAITEMNARGDFRLIDIVTLYKR